MKSLKSRMMHLVRRWHARIGVFAAVFFFLLALTGIALNHTALFGLANTEVASSWLMRWYGLRAEYPNRGYLFSDGYFAASSERWVMNGQVLPTTNNAAVLGVVDWQEMRVIATMDTLHLYTPDGQLVERLTGEALPGTPIKQLAVMRLRQSPTSELETALVIQTAQGVFTTNDALRWQGLSQAPQKFDWATEQVLPATLTKSLTRAFAPSLPLERIVLDLHSGRLFGRYGPLAMDVVAIVLLVLSLSGVWIYLRSVRKRPHYK